MIVLDQPAKNVCEKKGNLGGNAGWRIHSVHRRKKGPVDVRHCIHQKQFFGRRRHAREYSKAAVHNLRLSAGGKKYGSPGYSCSLAIRGKLRVQFTFGLVSRSEAAVGISARDYQTSAAAIGPALLPLPAKRATSACRCRDARSSSPK